MTDDLEELRRRRKSVRGKIKRLDDRMFEDAVRMRQLRTEEAVIDVTITALKKGERDGQVQQV